MSNRRSLQSIVAEARALSAAGRVRGKGWSLAQICDHLALGIHNTVKGTARDGPSRRSLTLGRWGKVKRWGFKRTMPWTGWFPAGVPAPESVRPDDKVSLEEALARLEAAVAAFERKCADPGASWSEHTYLGPFNARGWRRFHRIHAAHHYSFLRADADG